MPPLPAKGLWLKCSKCRSWRISYRRNDPRHHQQPDRLHHRARPRIAATIRTDIAKIVQAPVLHVNGDDIEAVVRSPKSAAEYRQRFSKDIVVDIVLLSPPRPQRRRRAGVHPAANVRTIARHPTFGRYMRAPVGEGVIAQDEAGDGARRFEQARRQLTRPAKSYRPNKRLARRRWAGNAVAPSDDRRGAPRSRARSARIGSALSRCRRGLRSIRRSPASSTQRAAIESGEGIDWPFAEALAFGSLCCEGTMCACRGQDSGTRHFFHRHAVLVDQETESALRAARPYARQTRRAFAIIDSPLVGSRRARLRIRLQAGLTRQPGRSGRRSSATSPTARK